MRVEKAGWPPAVAAKGTPFSYTYDRVAGERGRGGRPSTPDLLYQHVRTRHPMWGGGGVVEFGFLLRNSAVQATRKIVYAGMTVFFLFFIIYYYVGGRLVFETKKLLKIIIKFRLFVRSMRVVLLHVYVWKNDSNLRKFAIKRAVKTRKTQIRTFVKIVLISFSENYVDSNFFR